MGKVLQAAGYDIQDHGIAKVQGEAEEAENLFCIRVERSDTLA
jgi:hypothetical protein